MEPEKDNLIEGSLGQINRVKEMITEYKSLPKNAGTFAATMMQIDIDEAEKAISTGDTVQMIVSFKALNKYES